MFGIRELNVAIELWGVAFCIIGLVSSVLLDRVGRRYRVLFILVFAFSLLSVAGDAIAGIYRGQTGDFAWMATHVGNWLTFVGSSLLIAALTSYLQARITEAGGRMPDAWPSVVHVGSIVNCVLASLGVFYTIDGMNLYHRTEWFWVSLLFAMGASVGNSIFVLRNRRQLSGVTFGCLLFYTVAPIVASAVQFCFYGLNFAMVACILGLVVLCMELQTHTSAIIAANAEDLARTRVRETENRMSALVEHIHPELILDSIDLAGSQCGKDDDGARYTLSLLSGYLRSNFEELGFAEPIPVERELHHVRSYLELMSATLGDRLSFRVSIAQKGFNVPPLSVQAIVENAVNRVRQSEGESSIITVSSGKARSEWWVSVVDDVYDANLGRAKDIMASLDDVRERLGGLFEGSISVNASSESGTAIVLHLPIR